MAADIATQPLEEHIEEHIEEYINLRFLCTTGDVTIKINSNLADCFETVKLAIEDLDIKPEKDSLPIPTGDNFNFDMTEDQYQHYFKLAEIFLVNYPPQQLLPINQYEILYSQITENIKQGIITKELMAKYLNMSNFLNYPTFTNALCYYCSINLDALI